MLSYNLDVNSRKVNERLNCVHEKTLRIVEQYSQSTLQKLRVKDTWKAYFW